jgi:hypothetical protein
MQIVGFKNAYSKKNTVYQGYFVEIRILAD